MSISTLSPCVKFGLDSINSLTEYQVLTEVSSIHVGPALGAGTGAGIGTGAGAGVGTGAGGGSRKIRRACIAKSRTRWAGAMPCFTASEFNISHSGGVSLTPTAWEARASGGSARRLIAGDSRVSRQDNALRTSYREAVQFGMPKCALRERPSLPLSRF